MSLSLLLLLLLLLLSSFSLFPSSVVSLASSSSSNSTTIYDLLPKFGLPPGLFPDTVASFSLSTNGRFQVSLPGPCYVDDFDYLTYFAPNISGVVRYGGLDDLKGIQVRKMLIWFDVDAIKVDLPPSDFIYFDVGWITKKFKVDKYRTVHSCDKDKVAVGDGIDQVLEPAGEMGLLITE